MSTRREREQRQKNRENAQYWAMQQIAVVLASQCINPDEDLTGKLILLALRVSTAKQQKNGDLEDQELFLRYFVALHGGTVTGIAKHVGNGSDTGWIKSLTETANELGADVVLAESTDRLYRPIEYSKTNQGVELEEKDAKRIKEAMGATPFATAIHPDTPWKQVRQHQIVRGLKCKGISKRKKREEKGYRKEQKKEWGNRAKELNAKGLNTRRIATVITYESGASISHNAIAEWLRPATVVCPA